MHPLMTWSASEFRLLWGGSTSTPSPSSSNIARAMRETLAPP